VSRLIAKVRARFRNGLVLQYFQQLLGRAGIVVIPYYWIREHADRAAVAPPNAADCVLGFFGPDDMPAVARCWENGPTEARLLARLREGQRCFGARHQGAIACFTWANLAHGDRRIHCIRLREDEAYLHDMYTVAPFRGRGLAPYVRQRFCQALRDAGRERLYSYSSCLNTPAVAFKRKLNAEFLELGLYFEPFGKLHWDRVLWRYRRP